MKIDERKAVLFCFADVTGVTGASVAYNCVTFERVNDFRTVYITSRNTPCCRPVVYHKLLCYLMLTIYLHRTCLAQGQLAGFVGHTDEVFSATRQGTCWFPEKSCPLLWLRFRDSVVSLCLHIRFGRKPWDKRTRFVG
jgi:hypothetical protein